MNKRFIYGIQAVGVYISYCFIGMLPLSRASNFGGWLGRVLGPRLAASERARQNLRMIFPEKNETEIETIVKGMWDNLGRVACELPHLSRLKADKLPDWLIVDGIENLKKVIDSGKTAIFVSAHYGNWEIFTPVARHFRLPLVFVYRTANNPWIEKLIQHSRAGFAELIPKGHKGARRLAEALREGKSLALLADQKMNEGISVPFLGLPAKTASAPAHLALRSCYPVLPVRSERLDGHRIRVTFYPPLDPPAEMERQEAARMMTEKINEVIGEWIRERPEQWFWLHRRWPDSKKKQTG